MSELAWPEAESWQPDRAALLVIDMQHDFCGPGGWFDCLGIQLEDVRACIEPVRQLLAVARAAGIAVLHTRETYRRDRADLSPALLARTGTSGIPVGSESRMGRVLTQGEPGWDILPECRPLPTEPVIDKPGRGSLHGTDLETLLHARGLRQVLIAGVTTDCCVQSTFRDLADTGFECLLVAEACAASQAANHHRQLDLLRDFGGLYGTVASLPQALALLDPAG